MRLVVDLKYLKPGKKRGESREPWRYRRRVPEDLKATLGKLWIDQSLGTKDPALANQKYFEVHEKTEKRFEELRSKGAEQLAYDAATKVLKSHGVMTDAQKEAGPVSPDTVPQVHFAKYVDAMLEEADKLTPDQLREPIHKSNHSFALMAKAQVSGVAPPAIRLDEAIQVYLTERAGTNYGDLKKQVEVAAKALRGIVEDQNPELAQVTSEHVYKMRDQLVSEGKAKDTIKKRLGSLRAVFNVVRKRRNLMSLINPFEDIELPKDLPQGKRSSLSVDDIRKCLPEIAKCNPEAETIWHLLVLTGARPSEICRLRWCDVELNTSIPHICINADDGRPIKTEGSERRVPLAPFLVDLLTSQRPAAQDLSGDMFPRYSHRSGTLGLSAVLIKMMKSAEVWQSRKKVPYSLRHSNKDWMRRVARKELTNRIHGHGRKDVADDYGDEWFLEELAGIMTDGFEKAGVKEYPWEVEPFTRNKERLITSHPQS